MAHDNCNCGHDHGDCGGEDFQTVVISLDGEEDVECLVLGTFDVDGKEYIALQPKDDDEAMIFRYSEADGEVKLDNIESDEEYERVAEEFYEIFGDEDDEDFDDDDFDEDDDDDDYYDEDDDDK